MTPRRVLLVGGGHAHIEVLRRFAQQPPGATELTLVNPAAAIACAGMLPGLVAGHYAPAEAFIELAPLATAARAAFVIDRVSRLDLYARIAHFASGGLIPFDIVSLDVGSTTEPSTPGAQQYAIASSPLERFLPAWDSVQADALAGLLRTIAVVGGGAGGVEMVLAMQYRLATVLGNETPRFLLVSDLPHLLPQHSVAVRRVLGKLLVARDVVLALATPVAAFEAGALVTVKGSRIAADRMFRTTTASSAPWLAASGLDCDTDGFVRVNECLQSPSHPFVFAAGDCARRDGEGRPTSCGRATPQGPPLTVNLRNFLREEPLRPFVPRRRPLALISTGDRQAVASRGRLTAAGPWVWRWKDRIDRRFVSRYRIAAATS
jgi:selenide, water dikinase